MSKEWIDNTGVMPVALHTVVDVEYRNGLVNYHVPAGIDGACQGSIPEYNASDWSLEDHRMDIVRWRLHQYA